MYLANSPFWLQWLYPSLTWHKSRKDKCIYLTFDDGPIPVVTPFVLNILKKFNAKATFFCIGDNIVKHPDIYEQIIAEGHSVGNHTFNHLNGWKTSSDDYFANIKRCKELVQSNLFRPPYGRIKKNQISNLSKGVRSERLRTPSDKSQTRLPDKQVSNFEIIMWDVLSGDFDLQLTPQKCLDNVIRHTQNGSIIVFHDSIKAFPRLEYALPGALEILTEKGYSFEVL